MKITWYGHSAFRLEFGEKQHPDRPPSSPANPAFRGRCREGGRGHHPHPDHAMAMATMSAMRRPSRSARGQRSFFFFLKTSPQFPGGKKNCALYLAKQGIENFDPMNLGGTTDQGGFRVTMVRARSFPTGMVETDVNFPLGPSRASVRQGAGRADRLSHG